MRETRFRLIIAFLYAVFADASGIVYQIDPIGGSTAPAEALEDLRGVAVDPNGNVFFSDTGRHRVGRITPDGRLIWIAGTGSPGFSGDGDAAETASLNQPYGLAADSLGNLFIADLGNARIRRIAPDGRIQTIAGGGATPVSANPAPATAVMLKSPRNIALDRTGVLYFSDFEDHRVLRLGLDGRITVAAGSGVPGSPAGSAAALSAQFRYPAGLFVDTTGTVWIADSGNHAIRRLAAGFVTTLPVQDAGAFLNLPVGVCADTAGNLYAASSGYDHMTRITPAGTATVMTAGVRDVTIDGEGNLYTAGGGFVRKIPVSGGMVMLAGGGGQFQGENIAAVQARFSAPSDVKLDPEGALLVADTRNHRIRRISSAGVVTTAAGNGDSATLSSPSGLAVDREGKLYVADTGNHRVRQLLPNGTLQTVAGTGVSGYNGDTRMALEAQLSSPSALACDPNGVLYIADTGNHRIRRIMPSGVLLPMAGTGTQGFSGDGGGGLAAQLHSPRGLAFDNEGNLYIADSGNHRVRKLAVSGIISTVAGTGVAASTGDGRRAIEASLNTPYGIAIDPTGTIFISETGRVRRITPDGIIATVAESPLLQPSGIAVDSGSRVSIADRGNHRIWRLSPVASAATANPVPVAPPVIVEPELRTLHGATLESTAIAPGMILSLQGDKIGPPSPVSGTLGSAGALDTSLAGTQVRFDGRPSPILYAQENLINVQVPFRVAGQTASTIEVLRDGAVRMRRNVAVAAAVPGIFTGAGGSGQASALNEDFTLNLPSKPAARGSLLTFYATGEGLTQPLTAEGRLSDVPYPAPLLPVQVQIGGLSCEVVSAAASVTSPGVLQVTVRVPLQVASGTQPVVLTVGAASSQKNVTVSL